MYKFGDVVLAHVQFTDTFEIKIRPAVVLFEEDGNIVVVGISSNLKRKGISLSKKEGAIKDSIIRLNYLFTLSEGMIKKKLFALSHEKVTQLKEELARRLS